MPDAKPATAYYDIGAMRRDGYSDTSILNAIAPDFTPPAPVEQKDKPSSANPFDQFDKPAKVYQAETATLPQTDNSHTAPKAGQIEDGYRFLGGDPASEKNWETVTKPIPQPDNSHTVAWGVGIVVFVAVALLVWFKFKKTKTATGVGAAAQSPIYEQKENSFAEIEPHDLQLSATKGNAMCVALWTRKSQGAPDNTRGRARMCRKTTMIPFRKDSHSPPPPAHPESPRWACRDCPGVAGQ